MSKKSILLMPIAICAMGITSCNSNQYKIITKTKASEISKKIKDSLQTIRDKPFNETVSSFSIKGSGNASRIAKNSNGNLVLSEKYTGSGEVYSDVSNYKNGTKATSSSEIYRDDERQKTGTSINDIEFLDVTNLKKYSLDWNTYFGQRDTIDPTSIEDEKNNMLDDSKSGFLGGEGEHNSRHAVGNIFPRAVTVYNALKDIDGLVEDLSYIVKDDTKGYYCNYSFKAKDDNSLKFILDAKSDYALNYFSHYTSSFSSGSTFTYKIEATAEKVGNLILPSAISVDFVGDGKETESPYNYNFNYTMHGESKFEYNNTKIDLDVNDFIFNN